MLKYVFNYDRLINYKIMKKYLGISQNGYLILFFFLYIVMEVKQV